MVRAAVRTLTLSVYRVREPSLERFILERTAKPYFSQVSRFSTIYIIFIHVLFLYMYYLVSNNILFKLIYDCQQIAMQIDTQHEIGQMDVELLNEHMGSVLFSKQKIIKYEMISSSDFLENLN